MKQQLLANISKVTLIKRHDRFVYLRCPQGGRFLQGQFERSFRGSSHFHNFGSNPDTLKKNPVLASPGLPSTEQPYVPVGTVIPEPNKEVDGVNSEGASSSPPPPPVEKQKHKTTKL